MKSAALFFLVILSANCAWALRTVDCRGTDKSLRLEIDEATGNGVVILTTKSEGRMEFSVALDPYSRKSKHDLYTSNDLRDIQSHFNSLAMLVLPKAKTLETLSAKFPGRLEYRDYDFDYAASEYLRGDRGPKSNGYVLQAGSDSGLVCEVIAR